MLRAAKATLLVAILSVTQTHADSWPTHRHDSARSGYTSTPIDAPHLNPAWVWRSAAAPNPAWDGPARWDAYAGIRELPSMRQYDAAFHPISDGRSVYFGSSSQDTLYALDLETGTQQWCYVAGAPIRLAPTLWQDKIYFGCDDGYAYCLDAKNGELIWRFSPSAHVKAEQRLVISNQRLINFYPVRTGILVRDQRAYFGAALLPWREAFICSVDAETGAVGSAYTYVAPCQEATLEGAMLVADERLIVPQGRVAPLLFDRRNGKKLGSLPGGGGVTIVLAESGQIVRTEGGNPARSGQVGVFHGQERIASFPRGRAMVVRPDAMYVVDQNQLFAANRQDHELLWQQQIDDPVEIIMAGDVLFVGGRDQVTAIDSKVGGILWSHPVEGRAFGLAAIAGRLVVSTDQGAVHVFAPTRESPWQQATEKRLTKPKHFPIALAPKDGTAIESFVSWGPVVRFIEPGVAEIAYGTHDAIPTCLTLDTADGSRQLVNDEPTRDHQIQVGALPFRRQMHLQLHADTTEKAATTSPFPLDSHFDWTLPRADLTSEAAARLLASSPNPRGMAVVVGEALAERSRLLARAGQLSVLLVVDNDESAARLRQQALSAGKGVGYGIEFSVTTAALESLPSSFASVVVANEDSSSIRRLVRPDGGALWIDEQLVWTRPPLEGAGEWGHTYGDPDNSAFGGEQLAHATSSEDLVVQWIGRPGPSYQADRENRKPSPLASGGRLYLQGLQRLIALDAYSGSALWTMETPTVMRWNVPHDCSNWCADSSGVFVAAEYQAWLVEGSSGRILRRYDIPAQGDNEQAFSWGYIARQGNLLLGSKVKSAAIYTDWWGGANWFDTTAGADTHIVAGDQLFAVRQSEGDLRWTYDGLILHPTITLLHDRVAFVEDRTATHKAGTTRRIAVGADQRHVLVCLDAESGEKLWERPLTAFAGHVACLYLVGSREKGHEHLVLSASESTQGQFLVQCFDPETGDPEWTTTVKWEANHHGKHISHPAIQGSLLYLRPEVLDVDSGKQLTRGFPSGHGCASYALCTQGLLGRLGTVTWWDPRSKSVSRFPRLRTDCWISTIPALGMLLSPEGGGGCSCGTWFETSLAFLPRSVDAERPE